MNQYSAIREVRRLLRAVMEQSQRPELIEQLEEIDVRLKAFHDRGIDFKEVVDGLDDSIMITDAEGTVLYINPAYTRNTEITEEDVLNRDVRSLIGKDKLFTGGAVTSVLESGKSAFRLSTTYKTGEPLVGYVVGTPIFKEDGSLRQVVACSRPIVTLSSLQEDFEAFVKEINAIHRKIPLCFFRQIGMGCHQIQGGMVRTVQAVPTAPQGGEGIYQMGVSCCMGHKFSSNLIRVK